MVMGMDEYIKREAAYKTIMSETPDAHYPQWYADKILAIPAADVAPVRYGKWNVEWDAERDQKRLFVRIVCSNCGLKTGQKSNYCPNCGARMDLEV